MAENHKKPSREELEAARLLALEELDKPPEPTPSEPEPSTPAPSEPAPSEPAPSEPEPTPSEPAPSPDYKEKYRGSTREALVQKAGRDALHEAIKTADGLSEPTEDEMTKVYSDWEIMSETEQKLAKNGYINDRRFELINTANKVGQDLDDWIKKVEDFSADPKVLVENTDLEGKEEQFRAFSITPSRRGVPLEDLLKAFLYDATKQVKTNKGKKMFEKGSGGPGIKPKENDGKISMAEAETLRETNYDEYKKLVRAGKVDQSTI